MSAGQDWKRAQTMRLAREVVGARGDARACRIALDRCARWHRLLRQFEAERRAAAQATTTPAPSS